MFGDRLRKIREEHGVLQQNLAQSIGVSQGTVSAWENNVNEPKVTYIIALAKFFDVTSDFLLGISFTSL